MNRSIHIATRIASNTVVQLMGKAVALAISLGLVALLTRRLGVSSYGDYITALTISQFFAIITDLGFNVYLLKRLSTPQPGEGRLLGSVLGLRLLCLGGLLLPAAAFSFALPYSRVVQVGILVALFSVSTQTVSALFTTVLQARLEMRYAAVGEVAGRAATLILSAVFLLWTRSVIVVLLAQVAGGGLTLWLTRRWANRFVEPQALWQPATWGRILRESIPISVSTVLSYLYFKTDMIILSLVEIAGRDNRVEVGIYGAAYKVLDILILVPSIFVSSVFPVLSDFLTRSDKRLSKLMNRTVGVVLLLGGGAGIGVYVYAVEIVDFIAGSEYVDAVAPVRILAMAVFLNYLTAVFAYTALALNRQLDLVRLYAGVTIVNIAANLLLIPRFSYIGAAWVTVATELIVVAGTLGVCQRAHRLGLAWRSHLMLLAGIAGVGLVCWGVAHVNFILSILVLLGGFAFLSEKMRIVTRSDLNRLHPRRVPSQ